jgi:GDP-L-fucose synthase
MEKVLLIGSSGFLGSAVNETLLKYDLYETVEITGKEHVDITNKNELETFIKDAKPDYLINCAAFVGGVSYGYKYQSKLLEENIKMALNIYEISKRYNIKKIINPISNCVYPASISEYTEAKLLDGPPHESVYYYAMSKRFLIDLSNAYFTNHKLTSNNVILSNMYGPQDHFDSDRSHALGALINKIYEAKKNNSNIEIWGSGNQEREWLYVNDGAESLVRCLDIQPEHNTFNVGINKTISINDLANIISTEIEFKGNYDYNLSKPEGVFKKSVNGQLGENLLGWTPQTNLSTGIKETIKWYLENHG